MGRDGLTVYLPHVDSLRLPAEKTSVGRFAHLAALDQFGTHSLVDRPDNADIVLFTELHLVPDWRAREIRYHPLRRRFPEKSYCYDERDLPWPALPGLFVSERSDIFIPSFQVPWCYPGLSEVGSQLLATRGTEPDLLFSFVGAAGPAVRDALFAMPASPRSVVERVDGFVPFEPGSPGFISRRARFAEIVRRSKFILCPRGMGTSSFRLYEAIAAGRVPVILSDHWLPPCGPDWESFSVRWPERMTVQLPAYLESIEDRYEAMAAAASAAFDRWFRPEVAFHHIVEMLRPLVEDRVAERFPYRGVRERCALRASEMLRRRLLRGQLTG